MTGIRSQIEYESVAALYVCLMNGETILARATAFIVEARGLSWLVTARHNVTGRHADTGEPLSPTGAWPNRIRIWASEAKLGAWFPQDVDLYADDNAPIWLEHPVLGARADVVAIAVRDLPAPFVHHPLRIEDPPVWLSRRVTADVYVVGYPDGFDPERDAPLGVWTRGSIATEPIVNVGAMPVTLVDARTRSGQSGSPVFLSAGPTAVFENGSVRIGTGSPVRQLLGIYSGRTTAASDLGRVWRLEVVRDIVERGVRPTVPWGEPPVDGAGTFTSRGS